MYRRVAKTAVILGALATALAFVPTTAASAAVPGPEGITGTGDCSGNLVWSKNLNYGGTKIGELDIYYNASTGVNCAKMNHGGPTWGVTRDTYVQIAKCQETSPSSTCVYAAEDHDGGQFAYYAGPATVTAGSHCVSAGGYIFWQGSYHNVNTAATVLCG